MDLEYSVIILPGSMLEPSYDRRC